MVAWAGHLPLPRRGRADALRKHAVSLSEDAAPADEPVVGDADGGGVGGTGKTRRWAKVGHATALLALIGSGVWQPAGCVSCEPVCVCVALVRVSRHL